ncbi:MAG TPA: saccharopine dehydrogenase NADP-binding domain-containing protein [Polyangiales bacterium]|nr:saccharopine dehydrogenase NADP-binding domain-containing protein [Polyangiales bacterium]
MVGSEVTPQARTYDIVLFGATGFTGALTAEYLVKHGGKLRWALAGRNREKLARVRDRIAANGGGVAAPELIEADAADPAALRALAESTRVVITTVGPYLRYGEPLVAACAHAGTDYVDLTGESPFVTRMAARYHDIAAANGAKIVNACGFDSIPHDLGALFTVEALRRRLSETDASQASITVEAFVQAKGEISGGTWQSMLTVLSEGGPSGHDAANERSPLTAADRIVAAVKPQIRYRKEQKLWAVPFPSIDPEVVRHSARLSSDYGREFRYGHYLGMRRLSEVIVFVIGAALFVSLARFKPTRQLLAKLKRSGDGPTEAQRAKGFFQVLFSGRAGDREVRCRVSGGDPGYGETAKMLAESALCLAFDRARLPTCYGVVPSAAAMGHPLIERLQRAGIVFEELPG